MRILVLGALALLGAQAASAQDNDEFSGAYVAADIGILDSTVAGGNLAL